MPEKEWPMNEVRTMSKAAERLNQEVTGDLDEKNFKEVGKAGPDWKGVWEKDQERENGDSKLRLILLQFNYNTKQGNGVVAGGGSGVKRDC